jgi:hypothetical protein
MFGQLSVTLEFGAATNTDTRITCYAVRHHSIILRIDAYLMFCNEVMFEFIKITRFVVTESAFDVCYVNLYRYSYRNTIDGMFDILFGNIIMFLRRMLN